MTVKSFQFPQFSLDAASLGINADGQVALPTNAPLIETVSIVGATLVTAPWRWRCRGLNKLIKPYDDALRLALVGAVDLGFRLNPKIFVLIYNYHKYGNDFCSAAARSDMVVVYRVGHGADINNSLHNWKGAIEAANPSLITSYSFKDAPTGIFHELRAHTFVNGTYKHGGKHGVALGIIRTSTIGARPSVFLHSQTIVRDDCIRRLPSFGAMASVQ